MDDKNADKLDNKTDELERKYLTLDGIPEDVKKYLLELIYHFEFGE